MYNVVSNREVTVIQFRIIDGVAATLGLVAIALIAADALDWETSFQSVGGLCVMQVGLWVGNIATRRALAAIPVQRSARMEDELKDLSSRF